MNHSFAASRRNFNDVHAGPESTGDRSSHFRIRLDGDPLYMEKARLAHFRVTLRRTLLTLGIAGLVLGGTVALIAFFHSP